MSGETSSPARPNTVPGGGSGRPLAGPAPGQPTFAAGTIWRVTRLAFAHPWHVAIALSTTVIAAHFQLLMPRYLGAAVDSAQGLLAGGHAAPSEARADLMTAAGLLLMAGALRGLFTMLHNYFGESVGHHLAYRLRLAFYDKLQHLSFGFHDRVHTGDLITRGLLDLEGVRMFFNTGLVRLVLLANLIGIGAYHLMQTDVVLGFVALSFVPFVAWRSAVTRLRLRTMWLLLQEKLSALSRVMDENLGGIRVVRAFSAGDYEMAKFDVTAAEAIEVTNDQVGIRVRNTTAMTFSFFAAMGLVLWFGGQKVIAGQITVGTLTEFLAFMTILQMPVRQIGLLVNSFARASTTGQRLFEVLDLKPAVDTAPNAPALRTTEGVLRFENVSFRYDATRHDDRVLEGISFEVGRGRTLGIVGPPGSGKSTIANLIPRLYDVHSGRITVDDQDIREVTLDSLRRAVAVVQQDAFLFTASIENNVAYGDPWAGDDSIALANRAAQLHDYVSRLPLGYQTLVGERGVSLSGGQRQRLSIARSVLLEPSVLVFDDPTAAIDAGTEQRIRTALKDLAQQRTTIIISHRLSSLMHADEILFIEHGRITERGTHAELVARGGSYRKLYDLQVRPADAAPENGDTP